MTIPSTHSAAFAIPGLSIAYSNTAAIREGKIKKVICEYFNVTEKKLVKKYRGHDLVLARQFCQYLLFNYKNPDKGTERIKIVQIAKMFSQHHTSVIHSIRMIKDHVESRIENSYQFYLKELLEKLYNTH